MVEMVDASVVRNFQGGKALPIRDRYAVVVPIAAEYSGISRTRIYELLADGTLEGKVVRGRRLVLVASLMKFMGEAPSTRHEAA
jgi:hypothetical protein